MLESHIIWEFQKQGQSEKVLNTLQVGMKFKFNKNNGFVLTSDFQSIY